MAMLLVGACAIGAVALIAARQPSHPSEAASAEEPLIEAPQAARRTSSQSETRTAPPSRAPMPAVPAKSPPSDKTAARNPAAESPRLPAVTNVQALTPVTITGCLEMDRGSFRLKDTTGSGAPKSRSWKSGFLRKRPAQIELVDDANALKLPAYVGQRVVATGTLDNGEMRARSLKRVAASCE